MDATAPTICPYCMGNRLAIARSLPNLLRTVVNGVVFGCAVVLQCVLFLLYLGVAIRSFFLLADFEDYRIKSVPRLPLMLRCRDCGAKVPGARRSPISYKCAQCGYDLRGNVSGTCPECGWQIPAMTKVLLHYEFGPGTRARKRVEEPVRPGRRRT